MKVTKPVFFLLGILLIPLFIQGQVVNVSKLPNTGSLHPCVLAYDGIVMVVWREEGGNSGSNKLTSDWDIYHSIFYNNSWTDPVAAFATDKGSKNPHISFGPDGMVHLVWGEGIGDGREIYHGIYSYIAQEWSGATKIFTSAENSNWPRVGVSNNYFINVTWSSETPQASPDNSHYVIRNNYKSTGGWSSTGKILSTNLPYYSGQEDAGHSDIYARGNQFYAVWHQGTRGDGWYFAIKFSQKTEGGNWSTPINIDKGSGTNVYPRIAVDPSNNVHVLWTRGPNVYYNCRIGSTWQGVVRINDINHQHPNFCDIDVDSSNNVHAVYVINNRIMYNTKQFGGSWDGGQYVSNGTDDQLPALSVDNDGVAHIVWSDHPEGGTGNVMYTSKVTAFTSITVTRPDSEDIWPGGSTQEITWNVTGTMDDSVKIRLYNSTATTKIADITNNTPNNGAFSWTIPASLPNGSYIVRVKTLDGTYWNDSEVFTVGDGPPGITVTSPSSEDTWEIDNTYNIQWTVSGTMDERVKMRLYNASGTVKIENISDDTENDGEFSWTVPGSVPPGSYLVRIKTLDGAYWDDGEAFTISEGAPGITVTAPGSSDNWQHGNNYTIQWTVSGTMHGRVKIRLYNASGTVKIENISDDTENDGEFSWTVPGSVPPGSYLVRVKTLDGAYWDDGEAFTISEGLPTITVTHPSSTDTWEINNTYTLQWTAYGTMDGRVKIRLYNSSGTVKIENISNDTENDGEFSWTVPASVPPGSYLVRVKTLDGAVWDDGEVFTIIDIR